VLGGYAAKGAMRCQLELFPFDPLSPDQVRYHCREIRNAYWFIRNSRSIAIGWAVKRRHYRIAEKHKKSLLLAGFEKGEVLQFLRCCRRGCQGIPCVGCDWQDDHSLSD
jgi:hypothetical protein